MRIADETDWAQVQARALAAIALAMNKDHADADLTRRARYLQGIGLPRSDIAFLLGSTEESIRKTLERAKKPKKGAWMVEEADEGVSDPLARIANLLALIATRDMTQREQIITITSAGYRRAEVARLLGTTPATVSQTLYEFRQTRGRGARKAKAGK
jgi:predicted transcriptional regulator